MRDYAETIRKNIAKPAKRPSRAKGRRLRQMIAERIEKMSMYEMYQEEESLREDHGPWAAVLFWEAVFGRGLAADNDRNHLHYADALLEVGDAERALEQAALGYTGQWGQECEELILDILFGMGKDETAFAWDEKAPKVWRLDTELNDRLYQCLSAGHSGDYVELRLGPFSNDYWHFEERELSAHLAKDSRFEVLVDNGVHWGVMLREEPKRGDLRSPAAMASA